jgi:hypothetical protein
MANRIVVGTRKGLFVLKPEGGAWGIERTGFLGQPVAAVLHDRRDGTLYAALDLGHFGAKLHRSEDFGATWTEVAPPAYPRAAEGEEGDSVKLVWTLEAGGPDEPGALWAGTIPGGLFRSPDRGETWALNEALWTVPERARWFGGGYDKPGIHSVLVDPRDAGRIAVGVSCGGVWLTEDGGRSWQIRTTGMSAAYMPPELAEDGAVQDPHRLAQCAGRPEAYWIQHHSGIFRSTDDLASWRDIPAMGPSIFGFAVAAHPLDPDTAWFVPAIKDEFRYPVDGRFVVTRTRNGGRTAQVLDDGLPRATAYDLVYRHALDVDETGEALAMGSTTGGLWTSTDGGDRWTALPDRLPPIYTVRFTSV